MEKNIDAIQKSGPTEQAKKIIEEGKSPEMQQKMWQALLDYKKELLEFLSEDKGLNHEEWKKDAENKLRIPTYGRSMSTIADMFGMTKNELLDKLRGKKVLNIGPGSSTFASEAERGSDCEVVSIDADKEILKDHYQPKEFIIGDASKMPVKDSSFDLVFSTVSMPYYAESKEQAQDFFREVVRVLKIDGQANISPFTAIDIRLSRPERKKDLAEIQVGVIEVIEELLNNGKVEIQLMRPTKIQSMLPHTIFIKKIK